MSDSNAMWGWIAGAVVLALVLVFVFARGQSTDTTASNVPAPPATTGMAPPANTPTTPPASTPRPSPSTTGQGNARSSCSVGLPEYGSLGLVAGAADACR